LQLLPYSNPHPEVVVASSKTPSGGRLAGKYGLGMLCVTASSNDGFDALASNWAIANEIAAEHGHTMDRRNLRLVAPIHLAETREAAYKNVEFGLERWLDYSWANTPRTRAMAAGLSAVETVTKLRGGIVGTPDDAIELIERLQQKQGEFGCFLQMSHNWADWEATKKSYELYARFVVPHFNGANRNRAASLQTFRDNEKRIGQAQAAAIDKMFATHEADRAVSKRAKIAPRA
jgi:limonene 1,2-monooxygenase